MREVEGTYSKLVELDQSVRGNVPTKERPDEGTKGRKAVRTEKGSSVPPAGRRPTERTVEHRPYDFYSDQVRWLNRKKLELDERYGRRVPATAMVQLAVDMLIADYEEHGEDSQLVTTLIRDQEWPAAPGEGASRGEKGRNG